MDSPTIGLSEGRQIWDRSFGGYSAEDARFLAETEDGGFIIGGASASDNISGNKGVVGMGTWCVKLDASGVKEAEILLPDNYWTMLPKLRSSLSWIFHFGCDCSLNS
jgi:hypothetical protein